MTMIRSPVGFLITYPSNIFSCPPCRLPYTLTFSFRDTSNFLLSGNLARTKIEPELSVRIKPFSLICVIVPSIIVTGGNPTFLIGVGPAHELFIKTNSAPRIKKIVFIAISPFADLPNDKIDLGLFRPSMVHT